MINRSKETWASGEADEQYVGRWSRIFCEIHFNLCNNSAPSASPKPVCIVVSPLIVVSITRSCNNWLQDSMQIDEEKGYGSSKEQFYQKRISQLLW